MVVVEALRRGEAAISIKRSQVPVRKLAPTVSRLRKVHA
jgi:hypothetical protein